MSLRPNSTDPAVTQPPDGAPLRSLRPLAVAIALAATLSAVAGVAATVTLHARDAGHRSATGAKLSPPAVASLPSKPVPTTPAPVTTPWPVTSSIRASGGPWILFGAGEQATQVDAAGWDGRRGGELQVAPSGNTEEGVASFDGRHVIDANGRVWTPDGRFEGDANGASAWGDDSHTLCGAQGAAPTYGSTPSPQSTPVEFFTTVPGGARADVASLTPPGIYGDAHILACGTGDGSIVADVFSQVGQGSTHQLVRIHHGRLTQLLPSMQESGDAYLSAVATPDGRTVAYSRNDGRISLLDTATGHVRTLPVSGGVDALSWNGRRLLMELPMPRQGLMVATIPGIVLVDTAGGATLWRSPNHDAMDTMTLPRPNTDDIAVSLNTHSPSTGVFPTSRLQLVIVRADGREIVVAEDAWLIGPR